jgi:ATP synthase I chain
MTAIHEGKLFGVIIKGSAALLALLTISGLLFFSKQAGLGVLIGGIIAIVNFYWLRNVLQRILGLLPSRPFMYAQIRFLGRISITGFILYLIITSGWFSLTGILVGLSIIVINIIALSLYSALRAGG